MNIQMLIAACNSLISLNELAPEALALKQKLETYARDPQSAQQINQALQSNMVAQTPYLR